MCARPKYVDTLYLKKISNSIEVMQKIGCGQKGFSWKDVEVSGGSAGAVQSAAVVPSFAAANRSLPSQLVKLCWSIEVNYATNLYPDFFNIILSKSLISTLVFYCV